MIMRGSAETFTSVCCTCSLSLLITASLIAPFSCFPVACSCYFCIFLSGFDESRVDCKICQLVNQSLAGLQSASKTMRAILT